MKFHLIKSILFLSGILLFVGCNDALNLEPISAVKGDNFYTNSDEVESAVIAIYDGLQAVPLREFAMTEMRSDNTKTKSSEGEWAQFEEFDVQPTNQAISGYWIANYNVIFRANRVLENLDVVINETLKNQFEGEAKFARALAHFNLVRAFGNVPLVDKVVGEDETEYFDNDTPETVFAAIETDLNDAAAILPRSIAFGRASQGAANGMLAKVKLTLGDYSGAEALLSAIVSSNDYALQDEYRDVFFNEGNEEILFAIPYTDDDLFESQDFSFEMTLGGQVSGLNFITTDLATAFSQAGEERLDVLVNPLSTTESGKFLTRSTDARLCGNDWIVLRHADVLLMQSEAILAGADSTMSVVAIDAYNAVRTRAGMSIIEEEGVLTKDLLLAERRIELAFENHRLYDLIRFGKANDVLFDFATANGTLFRPTDLILPIPQAQINVSQGFLVQNPGY